MLADTRWWKRVEQGHLEWAMHKSLDMSCVMWKYKCPVLFLTTQALPIGLPSLYPPPKVPSRSGAVQHQIPTSSILVEYTTNNAQV